MIPVARTLISPATKNSWEDVDVSPYVDPGNTAGIVLEVVCASLSKTIGVRKNGSSDDFKDSTYNWRHYWVAIGVDSNDIFECYIQAGIEIYIVGYVKNSEGAFFVNSYPHQVSTANVWEDIDLASETGGDTAKVAFFIFKAGSNCQLGLRQNGSSDNRCYYSESCFQGAMMSLDGNEVVEGKTNSTSYYFYFTGYLIDNFSGWANAKDYSTETTDEWEDVDMSPDIPAGNDGAFFQPYSTQATDFGIRKNGDSYDNFTDIRGGVYGWVELDSGRVCEQKIEEYYSSDLWLWGYTSQPATPPPTAKTLVQAALISIPPLIALPTLREILRFTGV